MATFTTDGDTHFVSIVTGPSHVRLGLRFTDSRVEKPAMVRRPAVGNCDHGALDEAEIASAVASGIADVSLVIYAAEIIYVADDSPRYSLYARCAQLLAQRFVVDRLI